MAFNDFDPSQYDEPVGVKVIPDGDHRFRVESSEMKYWKEDKSEGTLSFKMVCNTDGFTDRYLFAAFNVVNPDPEREKKARTYYAQFCKALGHERKFMNPEKPVELNNKFVVGEVQEYNGKKGFVPWGWKPVGGSRPIPTPQGSSGGYSPRPHQDDNPDDIPEEIMSF